MVCEKMQQVAYLQALASFHQESLHHSTIALPNINALYKFQKEKTGT
jgi:hypothetical protein